MGDVIVSMDAVEPSRRVEFWREAMRPTYDIVLEGDERQLAGANSGQVISRRFGSLSIYAGPFFPFVPHQRVRDRRTILRSGLDAYFVNLVSGNFAGDFDGRSMCAGPGDIYVTDMGRPFACQVETGSTLSVVVPRDRLDSLVRGRNLHGLVLRADQPMARVITDCVVGLDAARCSLSPAQIANAEQGLLLLMAAGFSGDDVAEGQVPSGMGMIFRQRVLDFVDAHIGRPDLGPELLVQQFRVSRAHLYRAFEEEGGVATMIRNRRLDLACRLLAEPRSTPVSVKEVGVRCGFSASGQFVRAFRSRFAMTPGAVRREGPPAIADAALSLQQHLSRLQQRVES